jgi:hypothetical protein
MFWFHSLIFGLSVALQVLLLNVLRRGVYKEYSFVFAYSIVLFITTLADGAVNFNLVSISRAAGATLFYQNDAVREFLLLAVVISLIDRALKDSPIRTRVRFLLIVAAVAVTFLSFELHSSNTALAGKSERTRFILLMTSVTRDVSFGSMGLTFVLWLMLIGTKKRDSQLLIVTGGLGLQFAGEAIGQSLRQLSRAHDAALLIGNLVAGVTHLLRLYVWYNAFRKLPTKEKEPVGKPPEAFPNPAQS